MKINKKNTIGEVLESHPEGLEILSKYLGGQCFGCPMSQIETLEQAAEHHGADLKEVLKELNKGKE